MKNYTLYFLAFSPLFIPGCAKVYMIHDAQQLPTSHQIMAIVPHKVSIPATNKIDGEALKEQQRTESLNFQREMYSWILRRKMQNKIVVEVLDIETTNAKLRKAGYFDDVVMTPSEICDVLEVDGVLTSNYALAKPMSEGAAVALGVITGVWGPTNEVTISLDIHDRKTKKMIWNYNHQMSGSAFSSANSMVDDLMRQASKKMPYTK